VWGETDEAETARLSATLLMLKHGFATKQHNIKSVISLKQVFEYARNQNKVKPVTVSDI